MPREHASQFSNSPKPVALGTGLVALDVVLNVDAKDLPRIWAGGTCGNVLTVLSYLGWHSSPIARLGEGPATERVLADLQRWKVSGRFISVGEQGSTSIIIHRIGCKHSGERYHSFSWRCPSCGAYLPGYKPVLASTAEALSENIETPDVFFFDRVSRGSLILARAAAERGAVVVFEPSGIGNPALFREARSLAHIVKYSHERLRDLAELETKPLREPSVLLEIETLGADGLRFRSRLPKSRTSGWRNLSAFRLDSVTDAAGAGDWCTAGLIDKLARGGVAGLREATRDQLLDALRFGQALAAWNCGYEGARGGMYQVDPSAFQRQVMQILKGTPRPASAPEGPDPSLAQVIGCLCPACKRPDFLAGRRRSKAGGVTLPR